MSFNPFENYKSTHNNVSLVPSQSPFENNQLVKPQTKGLYDFDSIVQTLKGKGFDDILVPTNIEVEYVRNLFSQKDYNNIDTITHELVSEIAKNDFINLNKGLQDLTKKYTSAKMPEMFQLISKLSTELSKADIEGVWNDVQDTKPSLGQKVVSLFNKNYLSEQLDKKFKQALDLITGRASTLENEIISIEKELHNQYQEQQKTIQDLETSFQRYFEAFLSLRRSFIFCLLLEDIYERKLEHYKSTVNPADLMIQHKLKEYESVFNEIKNKKLIIHKSLLQLPIMSTQNRTLLEASRQTMRDINNTIISTLPMIRANIVQIVSAIRIEHGLNSSMASNNLENNLSSLSMKLMGDVAKKAATVQADGRLKDAQNISDLIQNLSKFKSDMDSLSIENDKKMTEAQNLLNNSTNELKQILKV